MPYLIVNADDLGISPGVNRAIFDAHAIGMITSTSLLTTGEHVEAAFGELKMHPKLDTGVHLCLHDTRTAAKPEKVPSLVDKDGNMRPLGEVIKRIALGQITHNDILTEYEAQVGRAREEGLTISHLDSHCHLHAFPPVAAAAVKVARRFGIRHFRRPQALSLSDYQRAPLKRYVLSSAITSCSLMSNFFYSTEFHSPDKFLGLVHSGSGDSKWILEAVQSVKADTTYELMVHPSDGTDPGSLDQSHNPYQRRAEYDMLISKELRDEIESRKISLICYRDLATCKDK